MGLKIKPVGGDKAPARRKKQRAKPQVIDEPHRGRPKGTHSKPTALTDDKLEKHLRRLRKQGAKQKELDIKKQAAVDESYRLIQNAIEDGVPVTLISEAIGLKRQWIYNMGKHRGRNGK